LYPERPHVGQGAVATGDGNRLSADASGLTTTYGYDRTGVLLSRFDAPTTTYYPYDAYGNLTSHASAVNANTTLTYDLADRLLTTVLPGPGNTTTAFTLDALGRIATRTPPGGSAEPFSYLGTSETVWAIGGVTPVSSALDPAGTRLASQSGATTGFLLTDLHGNLAAATTSGETALLSATRYDPFGVTSASWDGGAGLPTPWKFQARLDLTSNPSDPLYEFSARYYLPAVGAFSQLDSYAGDVGDPLSLHRYLYAAANPWTLIDPTGHYFVAGDEPGSKDAVYTSGGQITFVSHVASPRKPAPHWQAGGGAAPPAWPTWDQFFLTSGYGDSYVVSGGQRAWNLLMNRSYDWRDAAVLFALADRWHLLRNPDRISPLDASRFFTDSELDAISSLAWEAGDERLAIWAQLSHPTALGIDGGGPVGGPADLGVSPVLLGGVGAIRAVGGALPRNSGWAGRTYSGSQWTDDLARQYPNGVRFTEQGFPDFSPYALAQVRPQGLTFTNYRIDAALANRAAGFRSTPAGYVWHHVEDARTMLLIPQDLHSAIRHTGGVAVFRASN
jgi:RHS repeat-associated protein